jgi:hypothetical protein
MLPISFVAVAAKLALKAALAGSMIILSDPNTAIKFAASALAYKGAEKVCTHYNTDNQGN